tara:strand:- start:269 stop:706 length:438 start_codon:yes stop_codon:yes gene_type:complete
MRLIIQRVTTASVHVDGKIFSSIGEGLLCFVGFSPLDREVDFKWAVNKMLKLKVFRSSKSIEDINGEFLIVSQFTLFASIKKGNNPSWSRAAKSDIAKSMYDNFINLLVKSTFLDIHSGVFGVDMDVHAVNSGPLTLLLDTQKRE